MKKTERKSEGKFKIYINGIPDVSLMPTELFKSFISSLEREIVKIKAEELKNDNTRRNKE